MLTFAEMVATCGTSFSLGAFVGIAIGIVVGAITLGVASRLKPVPVRVKPQRKR